MYIKISSMFLSLLSLFGCNSIKTRPGNARSSSQSIYDFTVKSIDGELLNLSVYRGKKILIVNTASHCGYTPQYKDLEVLYNKYKGKLVVLGFPSNDFLKQEPGSNADISSFCSRNYGVTFPMFEKIEVKGNNKHPLYQWLSDKNKNGWNSKTPSWNFCKYLIDENGNLEAFFPSGTKPLSHEITSRL